MRTPLLDSVSVLGVFVLFALITFACYEAGFRIGRWWQNRMPGEQEGPTDMLVGSLLALMAFILAVTMGMAADRFDTRRGNVLTEANAIGAAYLQADYLPDPEAGQMKELLREYLPLRIVTTSDTSTVAAGIARSQELLGEMWAIHSAVARTGHSPDLMSTLGGALTDLVAISQTRVVAGLYARVPETILLLLLIGSALSLGMVGYNAGLLGKRSLIGAAVMIIALGVVLTLVIDLDRPQEGLVTVSQQALYDVQRWIGQPSP